jgi:hypothetical protein
MTAKKISDFADGGTFQAADAIIVARGSDNFTINGGIIANALTSITTLQANISAVNGTVSNTTTRVGTLEANVAQVAGMLANASTAITTLQANVATNANAITNATSRITTLESAGGSYKAPLVACYIYVNDNGTIDYTKSKLLNIANVVRQDAGVFTFNFTTPLPDTAVHVSASAQYATFDDSWTTRVEFVRKTGQDFTVNRITLKTPNQNSSVYDPRSLEFTIRAFGT